MIVIIFHLRSFFYFSLSFACLIRQRFEIIIIRFVSWKHYSYFLPGYLETWFISLAICYCGLFWGKELDKCKIFELAGQFITDLSYISDRHDRFEDFKKDIFIDIGQDRSSDHYTTVLGRLFFETTWGRLRTVAESASCCFIRLTAITFVPSAKVFIITFVTIPVIGYCQIDHSDRKILYLYFFTSYLYLAFQMVKDRHCDLDAGIFDIDILSLKLDLIRDTSPYADTQIWKLSLSLWKFLGSSFK